MEIWSHLKTRSLPASKSNMDECLRMGWSIYIFKSSSISSCRVGYPISEPFWPSAKSNKIPFAWRIAFGIRDQYLVIIQRDVANDGILFVASSSQNPSQNQINRYSQPLKLRMRVWKSAGGFMDPKKLPELVPVLFWRPLRHFDLECVRFSGYLLGFVTDGNGGSSSSGSFFSDFCTGVRFLVMGLFCDGTAKELF